MPYSGVDKKHTGKIDKCRARLSETYLKKKNPRTGKNYTKSDVVAICVAGITKKSKEKQGKEVENMTIKDLSRAKEKLMELSKKDSLTDEENLERRKLLATVKILKSKEKLSEEAAPEAEVKTDVPEEPAKEEAPAEEVKEEPVSEEAEVKEEKPGETPAEEPKEEVKSEEVAEPEAPAEEVVEVSEEEIDKVAESLTDEELDDIEKSVLEEDVKEEVKEEKAEEVEKEAEKAEVIKEVREELSKLYAENKQLKGDAEKLSKENSGLGSMKKEFEKLKKFHDEQTKKMTNERLHKLSEKFKVLGQDKDVEQLTKLDSTSVSEYERIVDAAIAYGKEQEKLEKVTEPSDPATAGEVVPEETQDQEVKEVEKLNSEDFFKDLTVGLKNLRT